MNPFVVDRKTPLLDFLLAALAPAKKTKVKQILKYGSVRINGRTVTLHRFSLNPGDKVEILDPRGAFAEKIKSRLPFPILFEDDAIVVIDKPAGLLTMGTDREKERTAYFALTDYVRSQTKDQGRIFIVHRLDREVSGLLVFAKTETAKHRLQEHWHQATKHYAALVEGVPVSKEKTLRSYLREDPFRRVYSTLSPREDSKMAVLHYRLVRENKHGSLLDITLETGRKNQIRVQLADLGHPIIGDLKYGAHSNPIGRVALHACSLKFPHPATGRPVAFTAKTPQAFNEFFRNG